jgi:cellulose synthase/poly-beta-1,6-N-acetylglucosamine synthase-like glycosyltransferase
LILMLFCLGLLIYVWIAYPISVILLSRMVPKPLSVRPSTWPGLSVVVAAYNEEGKIKARIANIFASDYPGPLEVLVGCDGCTDRTAEVVTGIGREGVRAVEFSQNRGRATVHNDVVPLGSYDIVVFTDAETQFEPDCLRALAEPFCDPDVGCSVGLVRYMNAGKTGISDSADLYWRMEEAIRRAESRLGILGFGTGACTAMRKNLFRPMLPWEDVDYAATLMLAIGGARIHYVPEAVARDIISESASAAFQTRVRQTSRSFMSILNHIKPCFSKRAFGIAIAALSHKTGRHLSPFFMLGLFLSSLTAAAHATSALVVLILGGIFLLLALAGYLTNRSQKRFRLGTIALTFFILNLARGIGIFRALTNRRVATYETRI